MQAHAGPCRPMRSCQVIALRYPQNWSVLPYSSKPGIQRWPQKCTGDPRRDYTWDYQITNLPHFNILNHGIADVLFGSFASVPWSRSNGLADVDPSKRRKETARRSLNALVSALKRSEVQILTWSWLWTNLCHRMGLANEVGMKHCLCIPIFCGTWQYCTCGLEVVQRFCGSWKKHFDKLRIHEEGQAVPPHTKLERKSMTVTATKAIPAHLTVESGCSSARIASQSKGKQEKRIIRNRSLWFGTEVQRNVLSKLPHEDKVQPPFRHLLIQLFLEYICKRQPCPNRSLCLYKCNLLITVLPLTNAYSEEWTQDTPEQFNSFDLDRVAAGKQWINWMSRIFKPGLNRTEWTPWRFRPHAHTALLNSKSWCKLMLGVQFVEGSRHTTIQAGHCSPAVADERVVASSDASWRGSLCPIMLVKFLQEYLGIDNDWNVWIDWRHWESDCSNISGEGFFSWWRCWDEQTNLWK